MLSCHGRRISSVGLRMFSLAAHPESSATRKEVVRLGCGPNQIKTEKAGLNNSDGCRPPQPMES